LQRWDLEMDTPGSRYRINTPSLVLDLDHLEVNLAAMAEAMRAFGKHLRPHVKSHKCSVIARHQRTLGANGICCATLDEAEIMAAEGVAGILITSPITTHEKIARLMTLIARDPDVIVVIDNPRNLAALAEAASRAACTVNVLIDVELGFGRTGVTSPASAVALAKDAVSHAAVSLLGLQAYGGHLQHIRDAGARRTAATAAGVYVADIVDRLNASGIATPIVSGGGTGTHAIDGAGTWFTEIQAGSYPLMDCDYNAVVFGEGAHWPFSAALFVQTAVVSANIAGTVTIDGGTKAIATNGPVPQVSSPGFAGATYEFTGDEHGRIRMAPGCTPPDIGTRIELIVSHCDPTVAMYDVFYCVRGDRLVDIWRIDARGRL
jgi:D-serine deaminase-like pyridoxal phosphate-dependent protein